MPKVSDAHLEARRTQILEAACVCIGRKGLHRTTIRDICAEAGLSAGAVYGYFKSKDDLVEAMAGLGRENTHTFLESPRIPGDAPASLTQLAEAIIDLLGTKDGRENSRIDVRLWGEGLHTPRIRELFLEAHADVNGVFAQIVREGQELGQIDPDLDPTSAARVWVALALGLTVQRAMDPDVDLGGCSEVIGSLMKGTFTRIEKGQKE
jgi:AcrR family transcriptional regulator